MEGEPRELEEAPSKKGLNEQEIEQFQKKLSLAESIYNTHSLELS